MSVSTIAHPVAVTLDGQALAAATAALKALAADPDVRAGFLGSPGLRAALAPAAFRYIVAADRETLWQRLALLAGRGYRLGVENVGEDVADPAEIEAVCAEYLALIDSAPAGPDPVQLGFDLSNVGLLVSRQLAVENTTRLLEAAARRQMSIVISMERSSLVERIVDVFTELAPRHPNIGLTVQAHLRATPDLLDGVIATRRKVRLVKGVYREPVDVAIPRGRELNLRYAELASRLLDGGIRLACGTHDATLLGLLDDRGILGRLEEIEMLHGVQPDLLRRHREAGVPCRIAAVYGENWWLHFLHRLAEYPPNVLTALADLADPTRVQFGNGY